MAKGSPTWSYGKCVTLTGQGAAAIDENWSYGLCSLYQELVQTITALTVANMAFALGFSATTIGRVILLGKYSISSTSIVRAVGRTTVKRTIDSTTTVRKVEVQ